MAPSRLLGLSFLALPPWQRYLWAFSLGPVLWPQRAPPQSLLGGSFQGPVLLPGLLALLGLPPRCCTPFSGPRPTFSRPRSTLAPFAATGMCSLLLPPSVPLAALFAPATLLTRIGYPQGKASQVDLFASRLPWSCARFRCWAWAFAVLGLRFLARLLLPPLAAPVGLLPAGVLCCVACCSRGCVLLGRFLRSVPLRTGAAMVGADHAGGNAKI